MTVSRKVLRRRAGVNASRNWTQRRDGERAKKADTTRLALIAAARALFTEHGYHAVGVRDFAAKAGVTRGALYHHFPDKEALFLAVFDAVERDLAEEAAKAAARSSVDPWISFRKGIQFYLTAISRADVQRITLIDGPAVLGWLRWRQLEERYSLGSIKAALKAAMSAKLIRRRPVEPLAHLIFGSVMEAALLTAHADQPRKQGRDVSRALDDWLQQLQ